MNTLIRQLSESATAKVPPDGELTNLGWFQTWTRSFAGEILQEAGKVVLELNEIERPLQVKIIMNFKEYFCSTDPEAPDPVSYFADEAMEYCEKQYNDYAGSMAWLWEEQYARLILEGCLDCIYECDPSTKMIVHEPYRMIGDAVWDHFYGEEDDNPQELD